MQLTLQSYSDQKLLEQAQERVRRAPPGTKTYWKKELKDTATSLLKQWVSRRRKKGWKQ